MSLWIELPEPLDAGELLPRAEREGVTYLPGRYFAVSRPQPNGLRISFAGMTPDRKFESGLAILGRIFQNELERAQAHAPLVQRQRPWYDERAWPQSPNPNPQTIFQGANPCTWMKPSA
jgi:hypothetical protein